MSNMLEQAIVDAKALKDAAFKSAQDALLEQYAPQIKEAVSTILEQEEEGELGGLFGGGGLDPDMGQGEVSGVADDMPLAATDGEKLCPCPDEEEEIEIDFDALEKQMQAEEDAEDMDRGDLAADLGMADKLSGEDEEEFELSEENLISMLQEESEELEEAMKGEKAKAGLDDDGDGVPDGADKDPKDGSVKESRNLAAQIQKTVLKETKSYFRKTSL